MQYKYKPVLHQDGCQTACIQYQLALACCLTCQPACVQNDYATQHCSASNLNSFMHGLAASCCPRVLTQLGAIRSKYNPCMHAVMRKHKILSCIQNLITVTTRTPTTLKTRWPSIGSLLPEHCSNTPGQPLQLIGRCLTVITTHAVHRTSCSTNWLACIAC
jgi:hypothetical protein